jgi:predicted metal-dependent phosphoesterase TrpH
MPAKLKVDFHTHTSDDPQDYIDFSSEQLIDRAADLDFDALAITNHHVVTFSAGLEKYAAERGLLLIPGVEMTLSNSHVVIVNPGIDRDLRMDSLADLAGRDNSGSLVIAPHPYYPGFKCLRSKLEANIAAFDAIEFSFFYNHLINPNRKAVKAARKHRKPIIGSSDCHNIWQVGYTYSLVEAEKSIPSIIAAAKEGKVEVATTPLPLSAMVRVGINWMLGDKLRVHLRV